VIRYFILALALALPVSAGAQDKAIQAYTLSVQHVVTMSWTASSTPNVTYNVYAGNTSGGPYTRINQSPVTALSYQDTRATAGTTVYYVVTAVDSKGNESLYSNEISAVIPSP
jgi:fibronectin type 3 domain-containing protein